MRKVNKSEWQGRMLKEEGRKEEKNNKRRGDDGRKGPCTPQ